MGRKEDNIAKAKVELRRQISEVNSEKYIVDSPIETAIKFESTGQVTEESQKFIEQTVVQLLAMKDNIRLHVITQVLTIMRNELKKKLEVQQQQTALADQTYKEYVEAIEDIKVQVKE